MRIALAEPGLNLKDTTLKLLSRCFSEDEWNWLQQEEEFRFALQRAVSVDDAEWVIARGLRLISKACLGTFPKRLSRTDRR